MKNRPCQRDTACLRADEKKLTDCDFADVDSNAVGVEVADDVDAGGYVDRLVDGLSGNLHAVEAIDLYGNNPFGGRDATGGFGGRGGMGGFGPNGLRRADNSGLNAR